MQIKSLFHSSSQALQSAWKALRQGDGGRQQLEYMLAILAGMMQADGEMHESERHQIHRFLSETQGQEQAEKLCRKLGRDDLPSPDEAIAELENLPPTARHELAMAVLEVAYADGELSEREEKYFKKICDAFSLPEEEREQVLTECREKRKQRERIMRSGTGIIAALLVIALFVLAATFLKSVLFGLMLAYFFLPLQHWYRERVFRSRPALLIARFITICTSPFQRLTGSGKDAGSKSERDPMLARSCHATVTSVVLFSLIITLSLMLLSVSFVSGSAIRLHDWVMQSPPTETTTAAPESESKAIDERASLLRGLERRLEQFRPKIEQAPLLGNLVKSVGYQLNSESQRRALLNELIKKFGGVFSYTTGILGAMASFLLNLLLTVFFFSFFLGKMASFRATTGNGKSSFGDYLVESIFGSVWLPATGEETRAGAREILNAVFRRLQRWVRGYLSIIMIETTAYISLFILVGVPYGPLLGLVAGFTILLPFIGPLASAVLTITVCLAMPGTSMLTILGVICIYIIINGIAEQFFLYPRLVGKALGMNIFETIVVVLLGGLFAGIPGVIFAVPTASVLKYLVPKIYSIWLGRPWRETPEATKAGSHLGC